MELSAKYLAVAALEKELLYPVDSLLNTFLFETGGTLSPSIQNKQSGATGLIQFLKATALTLNTTTDLLAVMEFPQQLVYVKKYYEHLGSKAKALTDPFDVYLCVLYPVLIGKLDSAVMSAKGSLIYKQNVGLDSNKDGQITKGEIREMFYKRVDAYRKNRNLLPSVSSPPNNHLLIAGGFGLLALVLYSFK